MSEKQILQVQADRVQADQLQADQTKAIKLLNDFLNYASFNWKLQLCITKYTGVGREPADEDEITALIADFIEQYA